MSVFTTVSPEQAQHWLKQYSVGALTRLEGISSGIENTNYFLTTTHGEFVLTLFEKIAASELPFYVNLMAHLANHGIPCPKPIANLSDSFLGELNGKPACLVTRLAGHSVVEPTAEHCAEVGEMLADMHLAGASYKARTPNPRGPRWWRSVLPRLLPQLSPQEAELASSELAFQVNHRFDSLPRGVIHADLFRDNVLFDEGRIGGVIDFYFACFDVLLFDLAITVNDWCVSADAELDRERMAALLTAYHATRPLTETERECWPVMLRAAAFRTWLGRLEYVHFPLEGELTHTKDYDRFRRILQGHIARQAQLQQWWV